MFVPFYLVVMRLNITLKEMILIDVMFVRAGCLMDLKGEAQA